MNLDRQRWEERYATKEEVSPRPASRFLRDNLHRLPRGRALDIACGEGRNAIFLARNGYRVDAIDIAQAGLLRLREAMVGERLPVLLVQADLDCFPLPRNRYDVLLNMSYLQRSLWPSFKTALRPGGVLVFETFTSEQRRFGHPSNPAFLLQPDELRRSFRDLDILHYAEDLCETETGPAYLARMLAQRPV